MTEHTTMAEDFRHVAQLLRGAVLDQCEAGLRALLSNNVNLIIAALNIAADKSDMRDRDRATTPGSYCIPPESAEI